MMATGYIVSQVARDIVDTRDSYKKDVICEPLTFITFKIPEPLTYLTIKIPTGVELLLFEGVFDHGCGCMEKES